MKSSETQIIFIYRFSNSRYSVPVLGHKQVLNVVIRNRNSSIIVPITIFLKEIKNL